MSCLSVKCLTQWWVTKGKLGKRFINYSLILFFFFLRLSWETWFNPWVGKIPWRRAWQSTPVFLLGESHGQMSLVDYSPCSFKESEHNRATKLLLLGLRAGKWCQTSKVEWQRFLSWWLTMKRQHSFYWYLIFLKHIYV